MKQKKSKLIVPNLTIILHKKSGDVVIHPTYNKMRKMLTTSLKEFLKFDDFVTLRVIYGKAKTTHGKIERFDNSITTNKISILKWASKAFWDRSLWLRE